MTQPPSQTDITVNITRNQKLSVSIEGAIESSQSSTIDTIILKSTAKFSKGSTNVNEFSKIILNQFKNHLFQKKFLARFLSDAVSYPSRRQIF